MGAMDADLEPVCVYRSISDSFKQLILACLSCFVPEMTAERAWIQPHCLNRGD